MIVLDSNAVEAFDREVTHHDHGDAALEERGRAPGVGHVHGLGRPGTTTKSVPVSVAWMEPGTTVPSRRKVCVPSEALCASAWSTVSK